MSETPDNAQFDVPAQILPAVIGQLATKLLANDTLLLFDGDSGALVSANESATMQLGLDLDNPIQPVFGEMVGAGDVEAETLWPQLSQGEEHHWDGIINGALGLEAHGAIWAASCVDDDGNPFVFLKVSEKVAVAENTNSGSKLIAHIESAVGTVLFDMDGNIQSMNERAQSVLEDYGEELVGKNHDALWPSDICGSEIYIEFWDKMRNGNMVEGRYLHLSAVGSEVWLQCTYIPIKDGSGMPHQVLQTLIDVTADTYEAEKTKEQADGVWRAMLACELSADGHVKGMNPAMAEALDHDHKTIIGMHDHDFCGKKYALSSEYTDAWDGLREGKVQELNMRQRTRQKKLLWFKSTLIPIMDSAGELVKVFKVATDVTDSFEEYIDNRELLKAAAPMVGRLEMDSSGKITKTSKYFGDVFRYSEEDILGRDMQEICSDSLRKPLVYDELWRKLHEGEAVEDDFEMRDVKGDSVWIHARLQAIFKLNGMFAKVVMFFFDETQKKRSKERMLDRAKAIDSVQLMIEYAPDGEILDVNDKFLQVFEYSRDDVIGEKLVLLRQKASKDEELNRGLWDRLSRGEPQSGEFRFTQGNGTDIWLRGTYTPIKNPKNGISRIVFYASDVTKEKHASLERKFKLEALSATQAVIEFDTTGNVLTANEGFLKTFGYTLREIIGQHHSLFCMPDHVQTEEYRSFWIELEKGNESHGRVRRLGRFDRDVYLHAHYRPVVDIDGKVSKIIKSAVDISELVQLELMLKETSASVAMHLDEGSSACLKINERASDLEKSTKDTKQSTQDSNRQLMETVDTFSAVSTEVSQLNEIVEVISEIAVQTNLLAFNAAIEAARAGEHGVGFSIVADEVRKLAERNSQAARGIGQNIQKATSQIEQGTTAAKSILDSLDKQNDMLGENLHSIDLISSFTDGQTKVMNDVGAVMTELLNSVPEH